MDLQEKKYPFRKASLKTLTNGKHHIEYWAWNIKTNKLQRFQKAFNLNKIENVKQRIAQAQYYITKINNKLEDGNYYDPSAVNQQSKELKGITFPTAVELFLNLKKNELRSKTVSTYRSTLNGYLEFIKNEPGKLNESVKIHTTQHIIAFLDYVKITKLVGNSTRNNKLQQLIVFFNFPNLVLV